MVIPVPSGEPILVRLANVKGQHLSTMTQSGIIQCMDCGHWTTQGREILGLVDCIEQDIEGILPETRADGR